MTDVVNFLLFLSDNINYYYSISHYNADIEYPEYPPTTYHPFFPSFSHFARKCLIYKFCDGTMFMCHRRNEWSFVLGNYKNPQISDCRLLGTNSTKLAYWYLTDSLHSPYQSHYQSRPTKNLTISATEELINTSMLANYECLTASHLGDNLFVVTTKLYTVHAG